MFQERSNNRATTLGKADTKPKDKQAACSSQKSGCDRIIGQAGYCPRVRVVKETRQNGQLPEKQGVKETGGGMN